MNPKENPCYGCEPPERRVGCHGTCERYKKRTAELAERKVKENAGRTTENYFGRKVIDSYFRKVKYKKSKTRRHP